MNRLSILLIISALLMTVSPVFGGIPKPEDDAIKSSAQQGFEEILDLWRDGKFDALRARSIAGGKKTKDNFVSRLSGSSRKPACCWEKIQDVSVIVKTDNTIDLRAKVGLEGTGPTEFLTRSFKMTKEDGVWKVSQSDILSIAGKTKKATHHKNKTVGHHRIKTINQ